MSAPKLEVKYNFFLTDNNTWRLQAWVSKAEGIDPNIFVYYSRNLTTANANDRDKFTNIACAADIEDYPTTRPNTNTNFYRLSSLDIETSNTRLAVESGAKIRRDIARLINEYKELGL